MLAASEFSIGFIGGVEALTLVLPIEKHDQAFLIVPTADGPIASTNFSPSRAAGMRVTNESWWPRFRSKWISHRSTSHHFPVRAQWFVGETVSSWRRALIECRSPSQLFAISRDLVVCSRDLAAGFMRWQVTLGTGRDRRKLWTVDLRTKTSEAVIGSST
jgi:hypothetical protein